MSNGKRGKKSKHLLDEDMRRRIDIIIEENKRLEADIRRLFFL